MKKLLIIFLSTHVLLFSCEQETQVEPKDPLALAEEEILYNQQLMPKAYEELARRITKDTIELVKKSSATEHDFLINMSKRTEGLFKEVVQNNQKAMALDAFLKIPPIPPADQAAVLRILTTDQPFDEYLQATIDKVELLKDSQDSWLVLKAYKDKDGNSLPFPEGPLSVDYDQVAQAVKFGDILVSSEKTDEELEQSAMELQVQNNIPPVLMGLLLPAVQHYTEEPKNDPFLGWLNTEIHAEINGGLNRDLIRRVAAAGYLGGINLLIDGEIENDNQDNASIGLMQARFETTLLFIWNEVWEN